MLRRDPKTHIFAEHQPSLSFNAGEGAEENDDNRQKDPLNDNNEVLAQMRAIIFGQNQN